MIRLIIPIPYYRHGGVERVMVSLITELSQQIEQTIIVASPKIIAHFQPLLPSTNNIVYESLQLSNHAQQNQILAILNTIITISNKLKIEFLQENLKKFRSNYSLNSRLNQVIQKYQATHCLYLLANRLFPPQLKIPLTVVIHDLFWHFAPLTYSQEYIKVYDHSLWEWLEKADNTITVSQKTKTDILSLFPQFSDKITAIPNAGFLPDQKIVQENNLDHNLPIFYFPSSFGIYKDHLTLLKAGLILAKKGLNFHVVLIGKETDKFVKGELSLSQQNQTQEYVNYLTECKSVYRQNQELIKQYFTGLGYSDSQEVEKWYQKSYCVVFPSKYEGFGLALSEAIVRGIPVIASDLEVFAEQVQLYQCSDLVSFFPQGNSEVLAKVMEKFIANPQVKLSQQKIADRFHNWTWKNAAQAYIKVLNHQ